MSTLASADVTATGRTKAVSPSTARILIVFEPRRLPTTCSDALRDAETQVMTKAGTEIPSAIAVRPTTACDRCSADEAETAPEIAKCAPTATLTSPNKNTKAPTEAD